MKVSQLIERYVDFECADSVAFMLDAMGFLLSLAAYLTFLTLNEGGDLVRYTLWLLAAGLWTASSYRRGQRWMTAGMIVYCVIMIGGIVWSLHNIEK